MKRTIKIIATFITLIIVNYNMCFADVIAGSTTSGDLSLMISLIIPLIFILGVILIVIELVTYICKKKKAEETDKIKSIINKTVISFVVFGSIYIFLYLLLYGGIIYGGIFLIGSIVAIIAREKKYIKLSNIVCGLVIIFSIISLFYLIVVLPKQEEEKKSREISTEIQQFNEKFTQYEGDDVRGSKVNSLLQQVIINNMEEMDFSRQIEVYFSDNCKDSSGNKVQNIEKTSTSAPRVSTKFAYKVKCNISEKGQNKGLVQNISLECNEDNQNVNSKN